MASNLDLMAIAASEATNGVRLGHGGPFGAVIVKGGKVIASCHNVVLKTNDPTMHAEIAAIRKASTSLHSFDLSGCKIYTSSEPCPMCLSAILWSRIARVYYGCSRNDAQRIGFDDDKFYREMGIDKVFRSKSAIKMRQLGRKECLKAFRLWENKKDKVMY